MNLPALFIGRFQPFHLGHLDALKQILAREKSIIIAIGSAENSGTHKNPFTAGARYQMITVALQEAGIKPYPILPVRDINNAARWVKHLESILPPFGTVYSGSLIVKKLFKKDGKHKVVGIKIRKRISGSEIRTRMAAKKEWHHFVPPCVAGVIKKTHTID